MTSSPVLPHVTVIVPCYNRADEARPAIQSVLDQDYPSFDVIAVDDHSTDDTLAVLKTIDAPNFSVVLNTRTKGVSGARNTGVDQTCAGWIAFQDSDDLWRPGKLRAQMEAVQTGDPVAVYCAMEIREGDKVVGHVPKSTDTHLSGNILPGLTQTSFISTQTVIIRRDIYNQVGGFDETLSALVDWELMLRIAPLGDVAYVDTPFVDQFMSGNSITKSTKRRLAAQEYVLEKHHDLMAQYPSALARHHHRIAGAHRQFGQYKQALSHAIAARRIAPGTPKYHLGALYTRVRALLS